MANNKQIISIGVQLDYKKELESMIANLREKLKALGDAANDIEISKNLQSQITALENRLTVLADSVDGAFKNLGDVNIDVHNIKVFQDELSAELKAVGKDIDNLKQEFATLSDSLKVNGDGINVFIGNMQGQFSELQKTVAGVSETIRNLLKLVDVTESKGVVNFNIEELETAKKLLGRIEKGLAISKKGFDEKYESYNIENGEDERVKELIQNLDDLIKKYNELNAEEKKIDANKNNVSFFSEHKKAILQDKQNVVDEIAEIQGLLKSTDDMNIRKNPAYIRATSLIKQFGTNDIRDADSEKAIEDLKKKIKEIQAKAKEAVEGVDVKQFTVKDGKITVPIEIDVIQKQRDKTLEQSIINTVAKLQETIKNHPIVLDVKLADNNISSDKDGVSKRDLSTQKAVREYFDSVPEDVQTLDDKAVGKTFYKSFIEASKEAYNVAKVAIEEIQKALEVTKITVTVGNIKIEDESLKKFQKSFSKLLDQSQIDNFINYFNESFAAFVDSNDFEGALLKSLNSATDQWAYHFNETLRGIFGDGDLFADQVKKSRYKSPTLRSANLINDSENKDDSNGGMRIRDKSFLKGINKRKVRNASTKVNISDIRQAIETAVSEESQFTGNKAYEAAVRGLIIKYGNNVKKHSKSNAKNRKLLLNNDQAWLAGLRAYAEASGANVENVKQYFDGIKSLEYYNKQVQQLNRSSNLPKINARVLKSKKKDVDKIDEKTPVIVDSTPKTVDVEEEKPKRRKSKKKASAKSKTKTRVKTETETVAEEPKKEKKIAESAANLFSASVDAWRQGFLNAISSIATELKTTLSASSVAAVDDWQSNMTRAVTNVSMILGKELEKRVGKDKINNSIVDVEIDEKTLTKLKNDLNKIFDKNQIDTFLKYFQEHFNTILSSGGLDTALLKSLNSATDKWVQHFNESLDGVYGKLKDVGESLKNGDGVDSTKVINSEIGKLIRGAKKSKTQYDKSDGKDISQLLSMHQDLMKLSILKEYAGEKQIDVSKYAKQLKDLKSRDYYADQLSKIYKQHGSELGLKFDPQIAKASYLQKLLKKTKDNDFEFAPNLSTESIMVWRQTFLDNITVVSTQLASSLSPAMVSSVDAWSAAMTKAINNASVQLMNALNIGEGLTGITTGQSGGGIPTGNIPNELYYNLAGWRDADTLMVEKRKPANNHKRSHTTTHMAEAGIDSISIAKAIGLGRITDPVQQQLAIARIADYLNSYVNSYFLNRNFVGTLERFGAYDLETGKFLDGHGFGYDGSVGGDLIIDALKKAKNPKSVINLHSHPIGDKRFYRGREGVDAKSDLSNKKVIGSDLFFSGSDLSSFAALAKTGVKKHAVVSGGKVHYLDFSQFDIDTIQKIANEYNAKIPAVIAKAIDTSFFTGTHKGVQYNPKFGQEVFDFDEYSKLGIELLSKSIRSVTGVDPASVQHVFDVEEIKTNPKKMRDIGFLSNIAQEASALNNGQIADTTSQFNALFEVIQKIGDGINFKFDTSSIDRLADSLMEILEILRRIHEEANIALTNLNIGKGLNEADISNPEVEKRLSSSIEYFMGDIVSGILPKRGEAKQVSKTFLQDSLLPVFSQYSQIFKDEDSSKIWKRVFEPSADYILKTYNTPFGSKKEFQTSVEDAYDGYARKVKDIVNINEELGKSQQEVKVGSEAFKFDVSSDDLEKIAATLREIYDIMQQLYNASDVGKLQTQWSAIETKFKSIAKDDGAIDARKKDFSELIEMIRQYQAMGGVDYSSLTDNKKTLKKISSVLKSETETDNTMQTNQQAQKQIGDISQAITKVESATKELNNIINPAIDSIDKLISALSTEPKNNGLVDDLIKLTESLEIFTTFLDADKISKIVTALRGLSKIDFGDMIKIKDSNGKNIVDELVKLTEGIEIFTTFLDADKITATVGALRGLSKIDFSNIEKMKDLKSLPSFTAFVEGLNKLQAQADIIKDIAVIIKETKGRAPVITSDGVSGATRKTKGKGGIPADYFAQNYQNWANKRKEDLQKIYKNVGDTGIKRMTSGIVQMTNVVQEADGSWKQLTATMDNTLSVLETSSKPMTDEQGLKALGLYSDKEEKTLQQNIKSLMKYSKQYEIIMGKIKGFGLTPDTLNTRLTDQELADYEQILKLIQLIEASQKNLNGANLQGQTFAMLDQYDEMINGTFGDFGAKRIKTAMPLFSELDAEVDEVVRSLEKLDDPAALRSITKVIADYNGFVSDYIKGDITQETLDKYTGALLSKYRNVVGYYGGQDTQDARTAYMKDLLRSKYGDFDYEFSKPIVSKTPAGSDVQTLTAKYKDLDNQIRTVTISIDTSTRAIRVNETAASQYVNGLDKFFGSLKAKMLEGLRYLMAYVSIQDIWRYFMQGVQVVRQFDAALTEMRKVSDEALSSLKQFQGESFHLADDVGTTALQIQQSTADFMRLGDTLNEAQKNAATANVLFNVSEFESIDEATSSLIAMEAAYKNLSGDEIIDKLNNIGNNYAISTDGIANALQDSASALTTAGNDIDESIALITAGNAVVQDTDKVGNGLRTIALRLTGTKAAASTLEELGEETEGMIQTESKLRQTIMDATKTASTPNGFDILNDSGQYKSTYEILQGIADIWEEIGETDKQRGTTNQNLLLETMAGKNRANILASILQNPDILQSVYSSSQTSSGSAQEELDKYLDSMEARIQRLTNAAQELAFDFLDSDTLKFFIDFGTEIIKVLDSIAEHFNFVTVAAGLFTSGVFQAIKHPLVSLGKDNNGNWGLHNIIGDIISEGTKDQSDQFKEFLKYYNSEVRTTTDTNGKRGGIFGIIQNAINNIGKNGVDSKGADKITQHVTDEIIDDLIESRQFSKGIGNLAQSLQLEIDIGEQSVADYLGQGNGHSIIDKELDEYYTQIYSAYAKQAILKEYAAKNGMDVSGWLSDDLKDVSYYNEFLGSPIDPDAYLEELRRKGALPAISTKGTANKRSYNTQDLEDIADGMGKVSDAAEDATNKTMTFTESFDNYLNAGNTMDEKWAGEIKAFKQAVADSNGEIDDSIEGFLKWRKTVHGATGGIGDSLKNIGATLVTTFASAAVSMGISLAIQGVLQLIYHIATMRQRIIETGETARKTINDTSKSVQATNTTLKTLGETSRKGLAGTRDQAENTGQSIKYLTERYVELRRGTSNNENISLSDSEYQEFLDISNKLVEIFPELQYGTDASGNAILNLGDTAEEAANKIKALYDNYLLLNNNEIQANFEPSIKGLTEELKNLQNDAWVSLTPEQADSLFDVFVASGAERAGAYTVSWQDMINHGDDIIDTYYNNQDWDNMNPEQTANKKLEIQQLRGTFLQAQQMIDNAIGQTSAFISSSSAFANLNYDLQRDILDNIPNIKDILRDMYMNVDGDAGEYKSEIFAQIIGPLDEVANSTELQDSLHNLLSIDTSNVKLDDIRRQYTDVLTSAFGDYYTGNEELFDRLFGFDRYEKIVDDFTSMVNRKGLSNEKDFWSNVNKDFSLTDMQVAYDVLLKDNEATIDSYEKLTEAIKGAKDSLVEETSYLNDYTAAHARAHSEQYDSVKDAVATEATNMARGIRDDNYSRLIGGYDLSSTPTMNYGPSVNQTAWLADMQKAVHSYATEVKNYNKIKEEAAEKGVTIDLEQTLFGNVDTADVNRKIEWTEETVNRYKSALLSWDLDDIIKDVENGETSISTVLGSYGEFTLGNEDSIKVAFTPIWVDDSGNAALMEKDAVYDYVQKIIGQIESAETLNVDAFLKDFDTLGLIADIGDTAEITAQTMHFSGAFGALSVGLQECLPYFEQFNMSAEQLNELVATGAPTLYSLFEMFDTQQRAMKYFTEDGLGVYSFMKDVVEETDDLNKAFVDVGKDGKVSFKKNTNEIKKLAENLNISTESAEYLLDAAKDIGAVDIGVIYAQAGRNTLNGFISDLQAVSTAMSEISSNGYMTYDTITNLVTANGAFAEGLINTGSGMILNNDIMRELNEQAAQYATADLQGSIEELNKRYEQNNDTLNQYINNGVDVVGIIETIKNANGDLSKVIDESNKNWDTYSDVWQTYNENTGIGNTILDLQRQQSEIRATVSLMQEYRNALTTPNMNANYLATQTGKEGADKLFKQGWLGTDDFVTYARLIGTNDDDDFSATLNYKKNSERMKRYLTEDASGVFNFFDDAIAKGEELGIKFDHLNGYDLTEMTSMEEFADAMGVTTEFAENMVLALHDAGQRNVDLTMISDGIRSSLSELGSGALNDAQTLEDAINKINKMGSSEQSSMSKINAAVATNESEINGADVSEQREKINKDWSGDVQIQAGQVRASVTTINEAIDSVNTSIEKYRNETDTANKTNIFKNIYDDVRALSSLKVSDLNEALKLDLKPEASPAEIRKAIAEATKMTEGEVLSIELGVEIPESLNDELDKVEQFRKAYEELNNLKANPEVDSSEIDTAQNKLIEFAQTLEGEDRKEFLAHFGIVTDENGVVQVEATKKELGEPIETTVTYYAPQSMVDKINQMVQLLGIIDGPHDSSVNVETEYAEEQLETIAQQVADMLNSDPTIKIGVEPSDGNGYTANDIIEYYRSKADNANINVPIGIQDASNGVNVRVSVPGAAEGNKQVDALNASLDKLAGKSGIGVNIDVSDARAKIQGLKDDIAIIGATVVQPKVGLNIEQFMARKATVDSQLKVLDGRVATPKVALNYGSFKKSVDDVKSQMSLISGLRANPSINISGADRALIQIASIKNELATLRDKTITITTYKQVKSGNRNGDVIGSFTVATGTAHALGTANAYAGGTTPHGSDVAIKKNQTALVNELPLPESIVRNGKWSLILGGAHFMNLKKGDIIFNGEQTRELIENGRVLSDGGHGKLALADGTVNAYAGGYDSIGSSRGGGFGPIVDLSRENVRGNSSSSSSSSPRSSSSSPNSSSNSSSAAKEAEDTSETIDWIEVKIDRLEREIEHFDSILSSTYQSWSARNSALASEISKTTEEIKVQYKQANNAYKRYIAEANKVSLSDHYKKLVQNGAIDIETIKDEKLAENIKNYQEWYLSMPFYPVTDNRILSNCWEALRAS